MSTPVLPDTTAAAGETQPGTGRIARVTGAVVDIEFPRGRSRTCTTR